MTFSESEEETDLSCSILKKEVQVPGKNDGELYKTFKFPVPPEMTSSRREPSQPQINKFIRDSVACLQAHLGVSKIGVESLRIAAKKICDKIPVLRDPKPAAFSAEEEFPYWSGVLYAMRKRLYNSTYYHKPKPEQPREVGHHQAPDQDEDKLYQKLSEELNKEN